MTIALESPTIASHKAQTWRWTREQYYRIAETGLFEGKRVELINGEIIEMSPMGDRHWMALVLIPEALRAAFGEHYFLNVQTPLRLSAISEPEPDVAVFAGEPRDYAGTIPSTATLVVEISVSTLAYDRTVKTSLYASADIPEYWIVNLVSNQVEVYRRPAPSPDQPFGFGYMDLSVHRPPDTITPLATPHSAIAVADLLP